MGETIDYTEVRGWRKTGQPTQVNPSFIELKSIRCIIHGPQLEDIYKIPEMAKSSLGDKTMAFTPRLLEGKITGEATKEDSYQISKMSKPSFRFKPLTFTSSLSEGEITNEAMEEDSHKLSKMSRPYFRFKHLTFTPSLSEGEISDEAMEEIYDSDETFYDCISSFDEIMITESDSYSDGRIMNSAIGEGQKPHPCRLFSLKEIRSATKNFDRERVIGKGRFGTVYRDQISGEGAGLVVAIKRLDSRSSQGESEFWAEISKLSTLRHSHLVSLIGYCNDKKETILVYEYIPNGSLYDHLHGEHTPLTWVTRLKIAIGAARGMDYLHIYGVIHHDVKSKNILLDTNWVAMISDFGLSNLSLTNQSNSVVNTLVKGLLTRKSDVYAFGVVLFELLSIRPAIDQDKEEDQCTLVAWAQKCVKDKKYDKLVDPRIKGKISTKCLSRFAKLAARCVHNVPHERPTMSDLVASLQDLLELQEKSNGDVESSGIPGFTWKIRKYVLRIIKRHSGQSGTSSQKNLDTTRSSKMNE